MTQSVYYRVATASEPSSSTWTLSSSQTVAGLILAYQGVDPLVPVLGSSGLVSTSSSTSITAPSVDVPVGGAFVVGLFGIAANTSITPPTMFTERLDVSTKSGKNKLDLENSDYVASASGQTGNEVAQAGMAGMNIGQLVSLAPRLV